MYNLVHNLQPRRLQRGGAEKKELDEGGGRDRELPYEFRALESVLSSVLEALHSELENLQQMVHHLLDLLDEDIDRERLRLLLQYRRKVSGLAARAKGVKGAVSEILDNDEDMALMYLSDAATGAPRTSQSLAGEYDALELLLESFDKQVR